MRKCLMLMALLAVTGCSSMQKAQFQSSMQDATQIEGICRHQVMGIDDNQCFAQYPDDEARMNEPYYTIVPRSECIAAVWHKAAVSQPNPDLSAKMDTFGSMIYSTSQDVAEHRDTAINRKTKLDNYLTDNFYLHPVLVRAQMKCHTDATATLMGSYPYPGLLIVYNRAVSSIADQVADGTLTPAEGKERFSQAKADLDTRDQTASAQAEVQSSADSSAFWQRMGNGFRALGQAQQANYNTNPYMGPPPMARITNCQNFGGGVQCISQ